MKNNRYVGALKALGYAHDPYMGWYLANDGLDGIETARLLCEAQAEAWEEHGIEHNTIYVETDYACRLLAYKLASIYGIANQWPAFPVHFDACKRLSGLGVEHG